MSGEQDPHRMDDDNMNTQMGVLHQNPTTTRLRLNFPPLPEGFGTMVVNPGKPTEPETLTGGKQSKGYLTYNNRRYKVRMDRNNNKYINCHDEKLFLKSIRGKYRYCS